MARKQICPKCGNDSFKISLSERTEVALNRKRTIVKILHITCAKCGWNRHLTQ